MASSCVYGAEKVNDSKCRLKVLYDSSVKCVRCMWMREELEPCAQRRVQKLELCAKVIMGSVLSQGQPESCAEALRSQR